LAICTTIASEWRTKRPWKSHGIDNRKILLQDDSARKEMEGLYRGEKAGELNALPISDF
jgi:hypothetical protein